MSNGTKLVLCLAAAWLTLSALPSASEGAGPPRANVSRNQSVQIDAPDGLAMAGLWNFIDSSFHESQGGGWGSFWFPFYIDWINEWWGIVLYDYNYATYVYAYYLFPDDFF